MRAIDLGMRIRTADLLKLVDESHEPRRQEDEVSGIQRLVRVWYTGRNEHGFSWTDVHDTIAETKTKHTFEHVPRLVISVVNVEVRGTAASPLANRERCSRRAEARGVVRPVQLC